MMPDDDAGVDDDVLVHLEPSYWSRLPITGEVMLASSDSEIRTTSVCQDVPFQYSILLTSVLYLEVPAGGVLGRCATLPENGTTPPVPENVTVELDGDTIATFDSIPASLSKSIIYPISL
jgi:hypothetical protein